MKNENLTHINNRSDFQILLKAQHGYIFPDCAFTLVFQTTGGFRYYVKSDDAVRFVPNEVRTEAVVTFDFRDGNYFPNGRLAYTIKANIPNPMFPDGFENTQTPQLTDIEIWAGASDDYAAPTEAVFILPLFKGDKGDKGDDGYTPIKGVDYWTPQDVAEMDKAKQSATDSAKMANAAAKRADEAVEGIADELAKKQDKITADNPIKTEQIANNAVDRTKLSVDLRTFVNNATDSYIRIKAIAETIVRVNGKNVTIPANEIVVLKPTRDFYGLSNGENVTFLDTSHWNTQGVSSLNSAFRLFSKVQTIDCSNWNTSRVSDIGGIFSRCSSVRVLDVSKWDTKNITSLHATFNECSSLIAIDCGGWDTSNVTDLDYIFDSCFKLQAINVVGWDTSKVTRMTQCFNKNISLTSLDLSTWDTSNVTNMYAMFYGCQALQTLDLSGFDTANVTNMYAMFYGCQALQTLDLSGFDTSNVTNMGSMFPGCQALQTLKLGNGFFKTPHVSSIDFLSLTKWTNATVKESLVTNSYDRAANGLPTMTLRLSTQTKAVLTDEDKQTMTNKGYTIA